MGIQTRLQHALASGAALLVAVTPSAPAPLAGPDEACTVERVVDGDTLDCSGGPRIRLIGIDAPELDQVPYGPAARAELDRLARQGTRVRIVLDQERFDRYGRTLAYVHTADGTFINVALARRGYAVDLTVRPNVRHAGSIRSAVAAARAAGAGLWSLGGFDCLPAQHRRQLC